MCIECHIMHATAFLWAYLLMTHPLFCSFLKRCHPQPRISLLYCRVIETQLLLPLVAPPLLLTHPFLTPLLFKEGMCVVEARICQNCQLRKRDSSLYLHRRWVHREPWEDRVPLNHHNSQRNTFLRSVWPRPIVCKSTLCYIGGGGVDELGVLTSWLYWRLEVDKWGQEKEDQGTSPYEDMPTP